MCAMLNCQFLLLIKCHSVRNNDKIATQLISFNGFCNKFYSSKRSISLWSFFLCSYLFFQGLAIFPFCYSSTLDISSLLYSYLLSWPAPIRRVTMWTSYRHDFHILRPPFMSTSMALVACNANVCTGSFYVFFYYSFQFYLYVLL